MFNLLCSKKSTSVDCNQGSHYDDFHCKKEAITQSILFAISKDEWNTKEDTGKSMKNA